VTDTTSAAPPTATAALAYAARGWRVIPLHAVNAQGRCTCAKCPVGGRSVGKHPIDTAWEKTPPLSGADVMETWTRRPWANVGVATGTPSGFFVLDIDPDNGGMDSMAQLVAKHGPMPPTTVQQTGSGGWHYFFALPDFEVRNKQAGSARWLDGLPGLDIRGTGGQVVMAPSVSGKGGYTLLDRGIAPAPAWLLEAIRHAQEAPAVTAATDVAYEPTGADAQRLSAYADSAVSAELARLAECRDKGWGGPAWNATTYSVACNLTEIANAPWNALTHDTVEALMAQHAPRDEQFGDAEIHKCLSSARRTVGSNARSAPPPRVDIMAPFASGAGIMPQGDAPKPVRRTWDDLGNAQRIVDHFAWRIRWVARNKTWAAYDGVRWVHDTGESIVSLIQQLLSSLVDLEGAAYDGDQRDAFVKWAGKQRMSDRVNAAERMARARPELQASPNDFDTHPMLLNVRNGIVDLSTGALLPHDPRWMLSQVAGVAYDPSATAPGWEHFLSQVMPDPHMRAYVQRISGYSATGDVSEQVFFVHQGSGANGKSQYLVAMQEILGDYNQIVPRATLLAKRGDQIPTDIARMVGKRFMQTSETARGKRLDEEVVKNLTGEEGIVARHLYGKEFEHNPTGKIHYVTNHLPRLSDADSIWRRLHLITWRVVIDEGAKVKGLGRMLARTEGPGILNWLVAGARAWQELGGLARPESAMIDAAAWRVDQDDLGEFIDDHFVEVAGGRVPMELIYQAYVRWVSASGQTSTMMSRQLLSIALRERGYTAYRGEAGRGFEGIGLRAMAPIV
jgi:putative DNA primase/helicase